MSINKGSTAIVDRYKGSQLVEKVYKGSDLIFDAFSEITGNLPLSFNAREPQTLKNYRIIGTAAGAGVQTINLLDVNATDTSNGYIPNAYLTYQGTETESDNYDISEYIPILAETDYSIIARKINSPGCCFYDATKQFISGIRYSNLRPRNFTTPTGAAYLRMTITRYGVGTGEGGEDMLLLGNYSEQPDFEPYGYKIPLTLTSGQNADNYPLYIGGTKLGEEEYVDYEDGKVYKYSSGVLTPTDPPTPLQAITAYQGENTISSTETVGNVTIKGRISEISPTP